jgi:hypothetical protein
MLTPSSGAIIVPVALFGKYQCSMTQQQSEHAMDYVLTRAVPGFGWTSFSFVHWMGMIDLDFGRARD